MSSSEDERYRADVVDALMACHENQDRDSRLAAERLLHLDSPAGDQALQTAVD